MTHKEQFFGMTVAGLWCKWTTAGIIPSFLKLRLPEMYIRGVIPKN